MNENSLVRRKEYLYYCLSEFPFPAISITFEGSIQFSNKIAMDLFSDITCSLEDTIREWNSYINKIVNLGENKIEIEKTIKGKVFLWTLVSIPQNRCINIYGIDISIQKNLEEKLSEKTFILNRRVKELNCLYEITKIIDKPNITLDRVFKDVLLKLQNAFQYPTKISIRLIVNNNEYLTNSFKVSKYSIVKFITVRGEKAGRLEAYFDDNSIYNGTPFLEGENILLSNVAKRIGKIMERVKAEDELSRLNKELKLMAFYDNLTGAMNRKYFTELLKTNIATYERTKQKLAVFFIDIDDFKKINDSLGHDFGDKILITVVSVIKSSIRKSDFIGRLGGDEFVLCINSIKSSEDALSIASKIKNNLVKIEVSKEEKNCLSVSIGIAIYPDDATGVLELFKYSDEAMYIAKKKRKGQILLYNEFKPIHKTDFVGT